MDIHVRQQRKSLFRAGNGAAIEYAIGVFILPSLGIKSARGLHPMVRYIDDGQASELTPRCA